MSKSHRDLLIFDSQITERVKSWKIADHPHTVVGSRRGFEVRVYHNPEWPQPYFVTIISLDRGWVMDSATAPTEAAARAEAIDILASLDGGSSPIGRA